ncbi:MAG TPA: hypothetical protein VNZ47_02845 [Candidatus Dormibacteraeota bacterium]|nr:hypothetical protein [Candidatus Dormibacteraeota bacterium]
MSKEEATQKVVFSVDSAYQSNQHIFTPLVSNFPMIFRRLKTYETFALMMVALVGVLRIWGDYDYSTTSHGDSFYWASGRILEIAINLPVVATTNLIAPWYPDWNQTSFHTRELRSLAVAMIATWLFWLAIGGKVSQMRRTEARSSRSVFLATSIIAVLLFAFSVYCFGVFVGRLLDFLPTYASAPPGITIRAMKTLVLNGIYIAGPVIWGTWLTASSAFCAWLAFRQRQTAK